jgi:hypothetical protein
MVSNAGRGHPRHINLGTVNCIRGRCGIPSVAGSPSNIRPALILGSTGATGSGTVVAGIGSNTDHARSNASLLAHAENSASDMPSSATILPTGARAWPRVAMVSRSRVFGLNVIAGPCAATETQQAARRRLKSYEWRTKYSSCLSNAHIINMRNAGAAVVVCRTVRELVFLSNAALDKMADNAAVQMDFHMMALRLLAP